MRSAETGAARDSSSKLCSQTMTRILLTNDDGIHSDGPHTLEDTLREVGDRIMPGKEPVRFFEMNLKRVGDTDWPAGGAIPMK